MEQTSSLGSPQEQEVNTLFGEVARAAGFGKRQIIAILSMQDDELYTTRMLVYSLCLLLENKQFSQRPDFEKLVHVLVASGANVEEEITVRIGRMNTCSAFELACTVCSVHLVEFLCGECNIQSEAVYKAGIEAAICAGQQEISDYLRHIQRPYHDEVSSQLSEKGWNLVSSAAASCQDEDSDKEDNDGQGKEACDEDDAGEGEDEEEGLERGSLDDILALCNEDRFAKEECTSVLSLILQAAYKQGSIEAYMEKVAANIRGMCLQANNFSAPYNN
jgi:hypothetical protein